MGLLFVVLFLACWGSVFGIVWGQMLQVLPVWPSTIYFVLFLAIGIKMAFVPVGTTDKPTGPPPNITKGVG